MPRRRRRFPPPHSPRYRRRSLPRCVSACIPLCSFVTSRYPALTIWRMNVEGGVPGPVDLASGGEDCLVVRPVADVVVRFMPAGGATFVGGLGEGAPLGEAAQAAQDAAEDFDLSANLAGLISAGAFCGYDLGGGNGSDSAS